MMSLRKQFWKRNLSIARDELSSFLIQLLENELVFEKTILNDAIKTKLEKKHLDALEQWAESYEYFLAKFTLASIFGLKVRFDILRMSFSINIDNYKYYTK